MVSNPFMSQPSRNITRAGVSNKTSRVKSALSLKRTKSKNASNKSGRKVSHHSLKNASKISNKSILKSNQSIIGRSMSRSIPRSNISQRKASLPSITQRKKSTHSTKSSKVYLNLRKQIKNLEFDKILLKEELE